MRIRFMTHCSTRGLIPSFVPHVYLLIHKEDLKTSLAFITVCVPSHRRACNDSFQRQSAFFKSIHWVTSDVIKVLKHTQGDSEVRDLLRTVTWWDHRSKRLNQGGPRTAPCGPGTMWSETNFLQSSKDGTPTPPLQVGGCVWESLSECSDFLESLLVA